MVATMARQYERSGSVTVACGVDGGAATGLPVRQLRIAQPIANKMTNPIHFGRDATGLSGCILSSIPQLSTAEMTISTAPIQDQETHSTALHADQQRGASTGNFGEKPLAKFRNEMRGCCVKAVFDPLFALHRAGS